MNPYPPKRLPPKASFLSEAYFFESELPSLWREELMEQFYFDHDGRELDVQISDLLFHIKEPFSIIGLKQLISYATGNLTTHQEVLPKLFYQILLILAESQIRQIEGASINDWLSSDQKEQIHTALSEKWLDPDSRSALESLV